MKFATLSKLFFLCSSLWVSENFRSSLRDSVPAVGAGETQWQVPGFRECLTLKIYVILSDRRE